MIKFRRRQMDMKLAAEGAARRLIGRQLIAAGYKILAVKLHPDRGGSHAAMARLNTVRDLLLHWCRE